MTATACFTSKPTIYQIQIVTKKPQFSSVITRNSSTSIVSLSEIRSPIKLNQIIKNDVNNNHRRQISYENTEEILDIAIDYETFDDIDKEEYLAFIGLRRKTKTITRPSPKLRTLAKRLAAPVCLLPLPKYGERVRQALYILLPFLKFLSIIHDVETFCSTTNENSTVETLLTRSVTQARSSKPTNKTTNNRKVSKSEFVTMAANAFRTNTKLTPMAKYIHSTINCHVMLDRLEQSTIDQIMQNFTEDNQTSLVTTSKDKRLLRSTSQQDNSSLSKVNHTPNQATMKTTTTTRTTITTMTTEKTTVKHKLSLTATASSNDSKRFKPSSENDCIVVADDKKSDLDYQRIYLKCFVCSKRQYIDAKATNSDILHSHWLEHGSDLSLNIYDSEIDSILTRVVEFFHFPKRHKLEGKIQTVFILNSKEIKKTSSNSFDDSTCIVID